MTKREKVERAIRALKLDARNLAEHINLYMTDEYDKSRAKSRLDEVIALCESSMETGAVR